MNLNSYDKVPDVNVLFKCPKCKALITYKPSSEDFEKINLSGLSSTSFDHGDHALLIYFDAHGKVRGWHIYEKEMEVTRRGLVTWKRVNKWKRKPNKINLLIASIEGFRYSDLYWRLETDWVLNYIEKMNKDIVKLKKENLEAYVFNTKPLYFAINGLRLDIPTITKFGKFFYQLSTKFGNLVLEELAIQRLILSVIKNLKIPLLADEAIDVIIDLTRLAKITVRRKLLNFLLKTDEKLSKLPNHLSFLARLSEEKKISLRELIEALSIDEIVDLIKLYYKLKKLRVLKVEYL